MEILKHIKLPKWDKSLSIEFSNSYCYFIDPISNKEIIITTKLEQYLIK